VCECAIHRTRMTRTHACSRTPIRLRPLVHTPTPPPIHPDL